MIYDMIYLTAIVFDARWQ